MNENLKPLTDEVKKIWDKFDLNQKFMITALLVVAMAVSVFFIFKATEPNWSVLYSDLAKQDVAAITDSLKKSGYGFKVSDDRTTILVKDTDKEDLRVFVAENDLIQDSSPGFELLDDMQLGSTDFKNKLTKQRIFQGELTRSIEKIAGIQKARVQLAEPERSVFSDDDEAPSASVILILDAGYRLKPNQILAIKNLVAYSVPRLTKERVFLTDQYGNALSEDVSKNSGDMNSYRTQFEKQAATKIKDTLETIMGKSNVTVQVSAVMDFNSARSTIEKYTPADGSQSGVVLTSQSEKEIYEKPQPVVIKKDEVLVDANNPAAGTQTTTTETPATLSQADENFKNVTEKVRGANLSYEKEKNALSYAVTKEVKQVVYAPGSIVKLSVAVAVNKILTDAEKKEIKDLVIAAAGLDAQRGDIVNVSSLKFTGIEKVDEAKLLEQQKHDKLLDILTLTLTNIAPLLVVLILGIIALSTFSSILKKPEPPVQSLEDTGAYDPYLMSSTEMAEVMEEIETAPEPVFTSMIDKKRNEISDIIMGDPLDAARLLTSYMKE